MVEHYDISRDHLAQFDALTHGMEQIGLMAQDTPSLHEKYYQAALLSLYGRAIDYLNEHPECADTYRQLGAQALEVSEETGLARSLHNLKRLRDQGFLSPDAVKSLDLDRPLDASAAYTPQEYAIFRQLFDEPIFSKTSNAHSVDKDQRLDSNEDEWPEEDVNTEDVIDYLRSKDLNDAELTFVERSLDVNPDNLSVIRKNEWNLLTLSDDEYESFVDRIPELRALVHAHLKAVGVVAKWNTPASKGAITYKLEVSRGLEEEPVDPSAGLKQLFGDNFNRDPSRTSVIRPERRQDRVTSEDKDVAVTESPTDTEIMTFAANTLGFIKAVVKQDARLNVIVNSLADALDTDRLTARALIDDFVVAGDVYLATSRGSKVVSFEPTAKTESTANEVDDRPEKAFVFEETDWAAMHQICERLAKEHFKRGETMAELTRSVGSLMDEQRSRQVIRQMIRNGILCIDTARNKGRARKGAMIVFSDKGWLEKFRNDPQGFRQAIQQKSETNPDIV